MLHKCSTAFDCFFELFKADIRVQFSLVRGNLFRHELGISRKLFCIADVPYFIRLGYVEQPFHARAKEERLALQECFAQARFSQLHARFRQVGIVLRQTKALFKAKKKFGVQASTAVCRRLYQAPFQVFGHSEGIAGCLMSVCGHPSIVDIKLNLYKESH